MVFIEIAYLDKVFDEKTSNEAIFKEIGDPLIQHSLQGFNSILSHNISIPISLWANSISKNLHDDRRPRERRDNTTSNSQTFFPDLTIKPNSKRDHFIHVNLQRKYNRPTKLISKLS